MAQKADVLVVCSGPSGVICGAYLAKAGLRTVVFESAGNIGGWKWGNHEIAKGALVDNHMHIPVWNLNMNGGLGCWPKAAREVGAAITWQCLTNTVMYLEGMRKAVYVPYCTNGKALAEWGASISPIPWPEETKKEMAVIADEMLNMPLEEVYSKQKEQMKFSTWIDERTDNELIKIMFYMLLAGCITWPTDMAGQASLGVFINIFQSMLGGAVNITGLVGGTADRLPKAFADVILEHGGQVLVNHPVTRILIDGGRAKGVVVRNADGVEETYESKYVVSAASYAPLRRLLGDNLPQRIRQAIEGYEPFYDSQVEVIFLLKRRFVVPDPVASLYIAVMSPEMKFKGYICFPGHYEPSYDPPGKQVISYEKWLMQKDFDKLGLDGVVQEIHETVEGMYPGIKDEIEATAVSKWQNAGAHAFVTTPRVPLELEEVQRLYFVGDYTEARGITGTERAADSAMTVAKRILRREGKGDICL